MKSFLKQNKGISLVALIITIIVMVILAGVTVANMIIDNGIIEKAIKVKDETQKNEMLEKIKTEYFALKRSEENKEKSNKEIFEILKEKLNLSAEFIGSESMIIEIIEDEYITLLEDGTIIEGKKLSLNIEDGNIDLKAKGFIQNNGELIEYTGDYIISGTTTEYCVRVMEEGNYNVTIKNLSIDVLDKGNCAFNANGSYKPTGCFVNINIEGENKLVGTTGLGFARATPNINGVINGSTLLLKGSGFLEVKGGGYSAAIGSGAYGTATGNVANIIINSGNITAIAGSNGCSIGGNYRHTLSNLVINGGNITAKTSNRFGIGGSVVDTIIINGGNITATGGEYGGAIGGEDGSKNIIINGGILNLSTKYAYSYGQYYALGHKCDDIIINGGTLICYSKKDSGIYSDATPVKINGGNIYSTGGIGAIGNAETEKIPINNNNKELYLTKIQLNGVNQNNKISSIKTSDNLNYGITDIYTLEDGMLYLYLPEGERQIRITAGGKTYTGTVTVTPENTEIFKLN